MIAHTTHHYVSTACHHMLHDQCRLTCKYCPTPNPCKCPCHDFKDSNTLTGALSNLFETLGPPPVDTPDAA